MKYGPDIMIGVPPDSASLHGFARMRHLAVLRFFGHPAAYAVGATFLTILSAGTAFAAPLILGPEAFGAFALLTTFFQLAARSDLGLSQLADRDLALGGKDAQRGVDILQARWLLGAAFAVLAVPLTFILAIDNTSLKALDIAITLLGGLAAMIAGGPVTLFRASSRIWEFTATALVLQLGMTLPRLFGLAIGGTTGCYTVLLVWYGVFSLLIARPKTLSPFQFKPLLAMIGSALPLFIFSTAWMIYLFANRWISSFVTEALDFGLFAFGANLSYIVIGTISAVGQAFYPKLIADMGRLPHGACSSNILRQAVWLTGALAIPLAAALPLAPFLISLVFPRFSAATYATMLLAVAAVPLSVVSWLLPIGISLSKNPIREALLLLSPAFLILIGGIYFGQLWFGIAGQAIGTILSALVAAAVLAFILFIQRALSHRAALSLIGIIFMATGVLAAETYALNTKPLDQTHASINGTHPWDTSPMVTLPSAVSPVPGWRLIFADEFDRLSLLNVAPNGLWEPAYPWGARNNPDNRELEYYLDPRSGGEIGPLAEISPFSVQDGMLSITARPTPPKFKSHSQGLSYLSGMLNTAKTFSFMYGYIEVRARIPQGRGLWPAIWMLPDAGGWPPEIDVMEAMGHNTNRYFGSLHSRQHGFSIEAVNMIETPDLSKSFGIYGLKWTSQEIDWYFNGKKVASAATPPDLNQPMYLLLNLAVGGGWAGPPDGTTQFPANFDIDYIRIYAP